MKFKDILLALCAPLLLGFGFAIAKPAMQQFPPFLLMGLRFTIAALVLVWWFPIPKKLLKDIFIVSLIGGTLTYGLVYTGLNSVDASSSILLVHTEVPFGVIIAFFLFKERPGIFMPALGQHSSEILKEYGFSDDEINNLIDNQIVQGDKIG